MDQFSNKKTPEVRDEEPAKAEADREYSTYVAQWKAEEGLPEDAVEEVLAKEKRMESANEGGGEDKKVVPISETVDFMMDRSRQ